MFVIMFIYLFLKEREREQRKGRERDKILSRFHAVDAESDAGLELKNHEIVT